MRTMLAGLMLIASLAVAQADCVPADAVARMATEQGVTLKFLEDRELKTAIDIYRAVTNDDQKLNVVAVADLPNGEGFFSIGADGALCFYTKVDANQWRILKNSIFGTDA